MSLEKFVYRNRLLIEHLEAIATGANVTRLFVHTGKFDPYVRDFLSAQERLLTAAERLLERKSQHHEGRAD